MSVEGRKIASRETAPTYPRYRGNDTVEETMAATCRALGSGPESTFTLAGGVDIRSANVGAVKEINKRIDQQAERISILAGISSETVARLLGAIEDEAGEGPEPSPQYELQSVHASIDFIERMLDRLERNVRRLDTL